MDPIIADLGPLCMVRGGRLNLVGFWITYEDCVWVWLNPIIVEQSIGRGLPLPNRYDIRLLFRVGHLYDPETLIVSGFTLTH